MSKGLTLFFFCSFFSSLFFCAKFFPFILFFLLLSWLWLLFCQCNTFYLLISHFHFQFHHNIIHKWRTFSFPPTFSCVRRTRTIYMHTRNKFTFYSSHPCTISSPLSFFLHNVYYYIETNFCFCFILFENRAHNASMQIYTYLCTYSVSRKETNVNVYMNI